MPLAANRAEVDEYVITAVSGDKTEALAGIEPFYVTGFAHCAGIAIDRLIIPCRGRGIAPEHGNQDHDEEGDCDEREIAGGEGVLLATDQIKGDAGQGGSKNGDEKRFVEHGITLIGFIVNSEWWDLPKAGTTVMFGASRY